MKILITGGKGMLGRTLQRELAEHTLIVADLPEWDITDDAAFTAKTLAEKPDVIIHCAAMTKVDDCEAKRDLAFRLNEEGSRNVAIAAQTAGARLIAISTDYVFSGEPPQEPWAWSETDIPRPRTVYGASKFAGEQMIQMILPTAVILRIAWLYGAGGPSFVHTMARLGAQEGAPLKVVDDQRGNPTSTKTVADVIRFLLTKPDVSGIVHSTCEDQCTWYDLTKELFRLLNLKREVVPCTTEEFPRPAPRPRNSALKKSVLNLLGYRTPNWRVALANFVREEFAAGVHAGLMLFAACAMALLAGCFTTSETPFPETCMSGVKTNIAIQVRGFEATITDYAVAYGWSNVYVPGYIGHHYCSPGYVQTVQTSTYVPQTRNTTAFLERARTRFEESGFIVMAQTPQYIVEVTFSGPFAESNEEALRALRMICTLFFSDSVKRSYHAKLKIYDNTTGKLAFSRDYDQEYDVTGWAIIPILGISHYEGTDLMRIKTWCLSALTDRATADASAFLTHKP